jgi:transcriptional regulator with XRE-family HTH domain
MVTYSPTRLLRARQVAGLTRSELGKQVGKSRYSIADYETGRRTPPADTLGALSLALGCCVCGLFEVLRCDG